MSKARESYADLWPFMSDYPFMGCSILWTEVPEILAASTASVQAGQGSLEPFLVLLSVLPRNVATNSGFCPSSEAEKDTLRDVFFKYETIAEWLHFLILGSNNANASLNHPLKSVYKPFANLAKSYRDLCIELHLRDETLSKAFATPNHLWMWAEHDVCTKCVEAIFLEEKRFSKRLMQRRTNTFFDLINSSRKRTHKPPSEERRRELWNAVGEIVKVITHRERLLLGAKAIADNDAQFYWQGPQPDMGLKNAIGQVEKTTKQLARHIRNTPGLD